MTLGNKAVNETKGVGNFFQALVVLTSISCGLAEAIDLRNQELRTIIMQTAHHSLKLTSESHLLQTVLNSRAL